MPVLLYIHSVSILNAVSINSYQNVTKKKIVTSELTPNSRLLPVIFVWGSWKIQPHGTGGQDQVNQVSSTCLSPSSDSGFINGSGLLTANSEAWRFKPNHAITFQASAPSPFLTQPWSKTATCSGLKSRNREGHMKSTTRQNWIAQPNPVKTGHTFLFKWKWHRMRDQRHLNYKFIKYKSIFSPMSSIRSSY